MTDSGFDPGLFDPALAGVHAVPASDLALLDIAARDAGLHATEVDLRDCTGKATLLLRMSMALDFPVGTGRNWDALSDRLRDLGWIDAPNGHALLFTDAADLRDAAPDDYEMLLSILQEAVESGAGTDTPFWAFMGLPDEEFDASREQSAGDAP
ncbi:barnase inhibitor [Luteimonas aestuarii]|uniref:Barnase inhibitor n=1 Tax=Luteimonas aestuarii TaxID=453837 RepID=A0A4R5TJA2_9GAMM|nr:barstar family protein [Luteimonas aestuarii]TDK21516.1 barnase inhibitor [Luteimonas aestuarii]